MSDIVIGFEDCPNHCNNGKLFDRITRKFVICSYCAKKRLELEKAGKMQTDDGKVLELSEVLGVKTNFLKPIFKYDSIIPSFEKEYMDKEILDLQKEKMEDLYNTLVLGKLPEYSMCFGVGLQGKVDLVAYPMLVKAYLSGLSVAKFISCGEYARKLYFVDYEFIESLINKDFAIMLVPAGSNRLELKTAQGFMQERALKGKPTIFLTTWSVEGCSDLLSFSDERSLFMATAYFVKYNLITDNRHTRYITNITGIENRVTGLRNDYPGESVDFDFSEKDQSSENVVTMADLAIL